MFQDKLRKAVRQAAACAAIIGAVTLAGTAPAISQTYPSPGDEAKLYELAKKDGTVVWYLSAPLEPMQALSNIFEAKYPGVKVQLLRVAGPQQYQRFMQETNAKQDIADMLQISDQPLMKQLIADRHISEWKVPTHDRISDVFKIGAYAYAAYTTDAAIVYNTNKVTPEEAELLASSWKSVTDPRFKGRFAMARTMCGACYSIIHLALDPKLKDEYGVKFLQAVADQKPAVYNDPPVAMDRLVAGEHDFVFWLWEGIAYTKWQQGAPIRWVRPSPTPEWGNSWQAISAHAPHPLAARLFHNWVLSEEGALAIQKVYGSATVVDGVPDTRAMSKEPWHKPIAKRYDIDFERWEKNYESDMALWQKIQDTALSR